MERIVSMTSWRGSIHRVADTVDTIRAHAKNAHIVLTLAKDEFEDVGIPKLGVDEVIWCPRNIGPFKKVLYTMRRYPGCPVLSVDDDIRYGQVVDAMYGMHERYPEDVISNFPNVKTGGISLPNGYATLYPSNCLDGALELLTDRIVATRNDDAFYGLILMAKGYKFRYAMRHDIAIFDKNNDGLHLLMKYHGNDDIKVIVSELYKSGKFNPTDPTFINKYPKEKYVLQ